MSDLDDERFALFAPYRERIAQLESQNNFDAVRLRTLASKCGVAVPESNEELLNVAGVVLGSIRRVVDSLYDRTIDCRTCTHMSRNLCTLSSCINADKYQPMARLKCWKEGV